jgi:opacity protein-like surface antigen
VVAAALIAAVPAVSYAQSGGQVQGFAGMTLRDFSPSTTAGGNVGVRLTDNIQIVAEGGRMADLTWAPLAAVSLLSPIDARVSAYYGAAGVRILGASNRVLRPYGEATAGFARMHLGINGLEGRTDPVVNAALRFLDSTQPMFGVGAGVLVQGGPVVVDLGYRFNKIGSGNSIQGALAGGDVTVQQVRLGVGFRF